MQSPISRQLWSLSPINLLPGMIITLTLLLAGPRLALSSPETCKLPKETNTRPQASTFPPLSISSDGNAVAAWFESNLPVVQSRHGIRPWRGYG
eukprot:1130805-Amorphochlora_amoeboformis.AAC.2